jgi:hypothetical protein
MNYDWQLNSKETEVKMRYLDYKKGGAIKEYILTEASPGEGFTKVT